ARLAGRWRGVSVRKSQKPSRLGFPSGVRGTDEGAFLATCVWLNAGLVTSTIKAALATSVRGRCGIMSSSCPDQEQTAPDICSLQCARNRHVLARPLPDGEFVHLLIWSSGHFGLSIWSFWVTGLVI